MSATEFNWAKEIKDAELFWTTKQLADATDETARVFLLKSINVIPPADYASSLTVDPATSMLTAIKLDTIQDANAKLLTQYNLRTARLIALTRIVAQLQAKKNAAAAAPSDADRLRVEEEERKKREAAQAKAEQDARDEAARILSLTPPPPSQPTPQELAEQAKKRKEEEARQLLLAQGVAGITPKGIPTDRDYRVIFSLGEKLPNNGAKGPDRPPGMKADKVKQGRLASRHFSLNGSYLDGSTRTLTFLKVSRAATQNMTQAETRDRENGSVYVVLDQQTGIKADVRTQTPIEILSPDSGLGKIPDAKYKGLPLLWVRVRDKNGGLNNEPEMVGKYVYYVITNGGGGAPLVKKADSTLVFAAPAKDEFDDTLVRARNSASNFDVEFIPLYKYPDALANGVYDEADDAGKTALSLLTPAGQEIAPTLFAIRELIETTGDDVSKELLIKATIQSDPADEGSTHIAASVNDLGPDWA